MCPMGPVAAPPGPTAYGPALSVVLALIAAFLFAVSATLQQGTARRAALASDGSRLFAVVGIARTLLTDRRWLLGQGVTICGFLAHAAALRLGAISVVQALLVVQLLFALPFATRRRGTQLLRRDWAGTVAVCGGLVVLVVQGVPRGQLRTDLLVPAAGAILVVVVLLVAVARSVGATQLRSALTAVAAGCCFATTAVLVLVATSTLPQLSWALFAIPVSTVFGTMLTQEAFARGSLPTALTAMTITDPVVSYAAGSLLFVVVARPQPVPLVLAAVLVISGVVFLANSPTLHDEGSHCAEPDSSSGRGRLGRIVGV